MSRVVAEDKVGTYACSVISVRPLNGIIFEIELQSLKGEHLSYKSGQYLALELDVNNDGQVHSLFYTIASRFNLEQPNSLQLIIQKNSEFSSKVIDRLMEALQNQEPVNIALPMGKAFLQTDLRFPHVLIAAGSGISKIKSIAEEILTQRPDANVRIYWSNRKIDDFFMLSRFHEWSEFHQNLHFTPILESADKKWCGRTGYIYEVIKEDLLDLSDAQTYLCGSPQMVYGTMDELRSEGLKQENCYSDVFEFAPKERKIAV
ncbi:NAD(P)H-flavin reductase [Bermanella marisrubri]|nr:NAD(P)H-flavin reductase [Bermanella marisrubri]QIZ85188.1 NAD(P)H-flavin reductase [Bermanella marisrubri]